MHYMQELKIKKCHLILISIIVCDDY